MQVNYVVEHFLCNNNLRGVGSQVQHNIFQKKEEIRWMCCGTIRSIFVDGHFLPLKAVCADAA
jgi:hypothetical protein